MHLSICLSVLLPVGYSHVGGGFPLSPEFRRITFLLPVSFHKGADPLPVCFFGAFRWNLLPKKVSRVILVRGYVTVFSIPNTDRVCNRFLLNQPFLSGHRIIHNNHFTVPDCPETLPKTIASAMPFPPTRLEP